MEHFTDEQIILAMQECRRVIKEEGKILFFWPPVFAPFQIVLNAIAGIMRIIFKKEVEFFPNEINLWHSRKHVEGLLDRSGLKLEKAHYAFWDLFSYVVVVASKCQIEQ